MFDQLKNTYNGETVATIASYAGHRNSMIAISALSFCYAAYQAYNGYDKDELIKENIISLGTYLSNNIVKSVCTAAAIVAPIGAQLLVSDERIKAMVAAVAVAAEIVAATR